MHPNVMCTVLAIRADVPQHAVLRVCRQSGIILTLERTLSKISIVESIFTTVLELVLPINMLQFSQQYNGDCKVRIRVATTSTTETTIAFALSNSPLFKLFNLENSTNLYSFH